MWTLLLPLALANPPGAEALAAPTACLIEATTQALGATTPLANQPADAPVHAAQAEVRTLLAAARELSAHGEHALAWRRVRAARLKHRVAMDVAWNRAQEKAVHEAVLAEIRCVGLALDSTRPVLATHELLGAKNGFAKAMERYAAANALAAQNETRVAFFKAEDALHQLDVAIGWQWEATKD